MTGRTSSVQPGSLFPALHRLEQAGWLTSTWQSSQNNCRAKFYALTKSGRKQAVTGLCADRHRHPRPGHWHQHGIFSMLNTLAWRQPTIDDPDGLITSAPTTSRGLPRSIPVAAVHVLARDGPLEHLCGYLRAVILPVLANDIPAQRSVTFVTGQCFSAFRITPILGRPIVEADAPIYSPGARVAVISYGLWTSVSGGDPSALGRSISVNNVDVEIIGVLPRGRCPWTWNAS